MAMNKTDKPCVPSCPGAVFWECQVGRLWLSECWGCLHIELVGSRDTGGQPCNTKSCNIHECHSRMVKRGLPKCFLLKGSIGLDQEVLFL